MNHWLPCWARITHGQKINCYELLPQGRVGTFPSYFQKQPWNAERWNNARACHERQSDKQTPGSVCHSMWQSQWKNNTRCSFSEIPWKRHLIPERWGAAAKAQIFADAVLLNAVRAQTEISDLWSQCLSLRRHREITLYTLPSSKHVAPTRKSTTAEIKGCWTHSDLPGTAADTTQTNKQGLARIKY